MPFMYYVIKMGEEWGGQMLMVYDMGGGSETPYN